MDVRHEGWSLGAVAHPVIDAEPIRTVYAVRDEQVVPLDQRREADGQGRPRGLFVQSALEVGNAFAGLGFGLFRVVVGLSFGFGLVGCVCMGIYWLLTQHPNSVKFGLVSLGFMFLAAMLQGGSYVVQQRLNAWIAKGGRRTQS